ncbi:CYTH domain-containing protein [Oharaeibacter diazotrophicus]|uniref:Adenylate cyclase n=1 Tax=Oharaeibacter diazotrophicus TaxID=1920512 RepID=A0A4R6RIW3_9HYPH|nr:CYTH domain-containing protein [Oharaeibacter diazotrophicus]TDP86332.1 adenylate cyclase [Oharaeibacter diazotrophicus]BBE71725.1 CYTH domain protein [Pleomorphomonas sp. SM30]GLS78491.1 adenylate cyclase [Oharaeibacter diazotrophicus]
MAIEIERKFLVVGEGWRDAVASADRFVDGLIAAEGSNKVRVRRYDARAVLTLKGPKHGISRDEFEYDIPLADADELLARRSIGPLIRKTRHMVPNGPDLWSVDVFEAELAGLVVAEIELDHEDRFFERPSWVGAEITHDRRYGSAALLRAALDPATAFWRP